MKLDVGCGCLNVHKKRGDIGIDINRGLADIACDARRMPFKESVFGSAICHDILEHVYNPEKILEEVKRVTKPCSEILIVYPKDAMAQESIKVILHPLVFFDLVLGFWKVIKRRRLRGIKHVREISDGLVSKYFSILSNRSFLFPRHLHNLEGILKREFTYGGWEDVELRCVNDK